MNQLLEEIKITKLEIQKAKHLIRIARSDHKKDLKELDRLLDGCNNLLTLIFDYFFKSFNLSNLPQ